MEGIEVIENIAEMEAIILTEKFRNIHKFNLK
jgi:hypothetical protein